MPDNEIVKQYYMKYSVEDIQARRLKSYQQTPQDICQHYQDEEKDRGAYSGRPILELLQNAEDALKNRNTSKPADVSFLLEKVNGKSFLYICNHGSPFNGRRLQAICDRSDSTKADEGYIGNKGTGFKSILNWTQCIEIHSGNIHCEFNRQKALALLHKHIGEQKLIELSTEERIWEPHQAPLLRLPHPKPPSSKIESLLDKGWDTVLCFEIAKDNINKISSEIADFKPEWLLFLKHIKRVNIQIYDAPRIFYKINRICENKIRKNVWQSSISLSLSDASIQKFEIFRQFLPAIKPKNGKGSPEIGIAVRTDSVPEKDSFIANFFPTDEISPLPKLFIHGTYLLTSNRNNFEKSNIDYHRKLSHGLAHLLAVHLIPFIVESFDSKSLSYLRLIPPAGEQKSLTPPAEELNSLDYLYYIIKEHLNKLRFLPEVSGTYCVAPIEVKLWRWGLGNLLKDFPDPNEKRSLLASTWQNDNHKILEAYDAEKLNNHEHIKELLDSNFIPHDFEQAVLALKLIKKAIQQESSNGSWWGESENYFPSIKIWLTEEGKYRPLNDKVPFFITLPNDFYRPQWLSVDILDHRYTTDKKINEYFQWLSKGYTKYLFDNSKNNIISKLIIPNIKNKDLEWWHRHGDEAFRMLASLDLNQTDISHECPFFKNIRKELAQTFKLPTSNNEWQLSWKFYAGNEWGGTIGEHCVKTLSDRYLLKTLDTYEFNKEIITSTLKYLGVSWKPKIIPPEENQTWCDKRKKLSYSPTYKNKKIANSWKKYCDEYLEKELQQSDDKYPEENNGKKIAWWFIEKIWAIEGLNEIATLNLSHENLLIFLQSLYELHKYSNIKIKREGPKEGSRQPFSPLRSLIDWQIHNEPIFHTPNTLLSKTGEYSSLCDMMIKRKGLRLWTTWIPTFNFNDAEDDKIIHLENTAFELGARPGLQQIPWQLWVIWYGKIQSVFSDEIEQQSQRLLSNFCADFVRHFEPANDANYQIDNIPCHVGTRAKFVKPNSAYIIDETMWLPLKKYLIKEKIPLFLLETSIGKSFAKTFKLENRLLSTQLKVYEHTNPDSVANVDSDEWTNSFGSKHEILALIHIARGENEAKKMAENWPKKVIKHSPLEVQIEVGGRDLGSHSMPHYINGHIWHISTNDYKQNIAKAFAYQINSPMFEDTLALYFSKSNEEADRFLKSKEVSQEILDYWLAYEKPSIGDVQIPIKQPVEQVEPIDTRPKIPDDTTKTQPVEPRGDIFVNKPGVTPNNLPDLINGGNIRSSKAWQNGAEAEEWFKNNINDNLLNNWKVVPGKGGGNKPFDLLLSNGEHEIYVEIKADSKIFYWSYNEVKKAQAVKSEGNKYIITIINPSDQMNNPENNIRWIFDPLEECKSLLRMGQRTWSKSETVEVSPWVVPELDVQPDSLICNFKFLINIPAHDENKMPKGWLPLQKYLSNLN